MTRETKQNVASGRAIRAAAVWLAVACVTIQLLAVSLCQHAASGPAALAHGPFPICHAGSADTGHGPTDDGGSTEHCPFCALHCHSAVAPPPIAGAPLRLDAVAFAPERPAQTVANRPRRIAGVSPRGPPAPLRTI